MYGALQGRDKKETAQQFGSDIVRAWYVPFYFSMLSFGGFFL